MSMMSVRSDPGGLRTLPPELRIPGWQSSDRGWHRLRHNDVQVQNYGGPLGDGARLGALDDEGNYIWTSNDPVPYSDGTYIDPAVWTPDAINAELNALASMPTPSLSASQMAAMEAASGLNISQTAPANSNPVAPNGMEWLTVADRLNNSLLKILVASKPGTYMQQLPNGMVLYSQQPGATGIPGLVYGSAGGGSVNTPLGSASFSGAMPLLIGGLVLLMFMGKR